MEYKICEFSAEEAEKQINQLAKDYWRVVSFAMEWMPKYPNAMSGGELVPYYYFVLARTTPSTVDGGVF